MFRKLVLSALGFVIAVVVFSTRALTIEVSPVTDQPPGGRCDFLFSGELHNGDLSLVQDAVKEWSEHDTPIFCLNSTGGDFQEALRISKFILERGIGTRLLENSRCVFACSILFMSGNAPTYSGKGTLLYRTMHKDSRLWFHAPFIRLEKGINDEKTVRAAYDDAVTVISALLHLSQQIGFDQSLIFEMLSHGVEHPFQIDTVDDAGRWNIQLSGYRYDADRKLTDEMLERACDNNYAWWGSARVIITRGSRQGVVSNSAIPIAAQGRNKTKYIKVKSDRTQYAGGKEWSQTDYYEPDRPLFQMGYGPEGALECSISIYSQSSRGRELHDVKLGFRYEGEKIEWLVRQDVFPWHFEDPRKRLRDLPKGNASDE